MKISPTITVIIPCYNQGQYLPEALESIYKQTFTDWECIIVNDGSTDQTEAVALSFCNKDSRFIYIKQENQGTSAAKNAGIRLARGSWIQFLDSDDYIAPNKFELSLQLLEGDSSLGLVVSDYRLFTETSKNIRGYILKQEYLSFESILFKWTNEFTMPIHCALFRTEFIKNAMFHENFKGAEDWLMWVSIFKQGIEGIYIDKPLAFYREHQSSATKNIELMYENWGRAYLYLMDTLSDDCKQEFVANAIKSLIKKLAGTNIQLLKLNDKVKYLEQTKDYRLGKAMLKIPRKIKSFLISKFS